MPVTQQTATRVGKPAAKPLLSAPRKARGGQGQVRRRQLHCHRPSLLELPEYAKAPLCGAFGWMPPVKERYRAVAEPAVIVYQHFVAVPILRARLRPHPIVSVRRPMVRFAAPSCHGNNRGGTSERGTEREGGEERDGANHANPPCGLT